MLIFIPVLFQSEMTGHIRKSPDNCQTLFARQENYVLTMTSEDNQSGKNPEKKGSAYVRFSNWLLVLLGKPLGTIAYGLDLRHRRIAKRNLEFAFPQWPKSKIKGISRRVFQNLGVTFLEILQMSFLSRQDILNKVEVKNGEYIEKVLDHPNGVILISAHMGNWEMSHVFASAYFNRPVALVARALDSKILDRWINVIRSKFGNRVWYKKGALSQMARTLRNGGIVGMLIDQETRDSEGCVATFFNHAVNVTPAAALLARRYDCPVLPVFCIRRNPGNQLVLVVEPPLELVKTGDRQADIAINTQKMIHAVEKIACDYPEQWFWVHKRWKRHHPEIYPEYMKKREKRHRKKKN
jgi:Kdo2-lipid IVA lauroyltransferase/acyltransferase